VNSRVINWFGHDEQFRSNPFGIGVTPRPYDLQKHLHDRNHPVSHEITGELRTLLDSYDDRMMVCEVSSEAPGDPGLSASYVGAGKSHMAFDFALLFQKWNPKSYFSALTTWDELMKDDDRWPCSVMSNHDKPRSRSRFGSDASAKAKVAAVMHMTLRGTPFLYYGEEIGMENGKISKAQLSDPVGIRYWPVPTGRDPERTPMQWDASPNAGFTTGTPWLPVHWNRESINVETQTGDERSLLGLYKRLIALRNGSRVLQRGAWTPVHDGGDGVISYYRSLGTERNLIVLNFRNKPVTVEPSAQWPELTANLTVELSTHRRPGSAPGNDSIYLDPLEATIFSCPSRATPG
jgi:alpha-glucosidase